jgi:polar amino acid transport system substrate-binding protein
MVDAAGNLAGIDIDLVHALEKRLGVTIEIELHPWSRCLEMMRDGEVDLMSGLAWSEDRARYILYLKPSYHSVQPVFYTLSGKGSAIATYNDLFGKRIGQSMNTVYFEPYNSDVRLFKVDLSSETQILQLLSLGRIDVAVGTDPNISWDIKRLGYKGVFEHTAYLPPVKTELYIGVSKKSGTMTNVDELERALAELIQDGSVNGFVEKYH